MEKINYKGGKLTLVQSVLMSLPIYFFSIRRAPSKTIKDIEKLIRDFVWGGSDNGSHLVKWEWASLPIPQGGLVVEALNTALLLKWQWTFSQKDPALLGHATLEKENRQQTLAPNYEGQGALLESGEILSVRWHENLVLERFVYR